jgi:hypothetical protein
VESYLLFIIENDPLPHCQLCAAAAVVFYERGARKNFSHAGGMKDSFDRQPLTC